MKLVDFIRIKVRQSPDFVFNADFYQDFQI